MNATAHPLPSAHRRHSRWRSAALVALAGLLPFVSGCLVHRQGIDLLEDGLWLLGSRVLADGGWLHRDLYVADGPARYALLLPFWGIFGRNALALALLKATCDGIAGALGFWAVRRAGGGRAAWLAPLASVALAPMAPALLACGGVTLVWAAALERGLAPRREVVLGAAAGSLMAFGVGPFAMGAAALTLTAALHVAALHATPRRAALAAVGRLACGAALALLGLAAVHAARGSLAMTWSAEVVQPITAWRSQWAHEGAGSWLGAFRDGPWLSLPFAEVATGEQLGAAWPAHAAVRAFAFRVLYLASWLAPLIGVGALILRRRGGLGAGLCAFAICSWGVLLPAGDVPHLKQCAWAPLLVGALLLGELAERRQVSRTGAAATWVVGVALLCALVPPAAERAWLVAHARRPALVTWDRPRARVKVSEPRRRGLEEAFAAIAASTTAPQGSAERPPATLVWPHQPGLYFLMDLPLPTAQVVLEPGSVRDPARVIQQLESTRPEHALLGLRPSVSGAYLRRVTPQLWTYLRENYSVLGNLAEQPDPFRVLQRAAGGQPEILTLPLTQRLADQEQAVANDVGPALRPDQTVGQTFPVGQLDLAGFAVRWRTRGTNIPMRLRVGIWQQSGEAFDTLVDFFDVSVTVAGDLDRSWLRFAPVEHTANTKIALTLELLEPITDEVRPMWDRHQATGTRTDIFPEGTALVNMEPVDADLWFFSF